MPNSLRNSSSLLPPVIRLFWQRPPPRFPVALVLCPTVHTLRPCSCVWLHVWTGGGGGAVCFEDQTILTLVESTVALFGCDKHRDRPQQHFRPVWQDFSPWWGKGHLQHLAMDQWLLASGWVTAFTCFASSITDVSLNHFSLCISYSTHFILGFFCFAFYKKKTKFWLTKVSIVCCTHTHGWKPHSPLGVVKWKGDWFSFVTLTMSHNQIGIFHTETHADGWSDTSLYGQKRMAVCVEGISRQTNTHTHTSTAAHSFVAFTQLAISYLCLQSLPKWKQSILGVY